MEKFLRNIYIKINKKDHLKLALCHHFSVKEQSPSLYQKGIRNEESAIVCTTIEIQFLA